MPSILYPLPGSNTALLLFFFHHCAVPTPSVDGADENGHTASAPWLDPTTIDTNTAHTRSAHQDRARRETSGGIGGPEPIAGELGAQCGKGGRRGRENTRRAGATSKAEGKSRLLRAISYRPKATERRRD